jgi:DNA repair protein RadD
MMHLFAEPTLQSNSLWEHQYGLITQIYNAIARGERRIVCPSPTGSRKTRISAEIIKRALIEGKRAEITVPRVTLIEQSIRDFAREGIVDIGVIQRLHRRTDARAGVQICSVQTLARRDRPNVDIVIVDECHLQYRSLIKWMEDTAWAHVPFIGMSATPGSKGMARYWHCLLKATPISELIAREVLCPFRIFAPPGPDLTGLRTIRGDYNESDLSDVCDRKEITGNVVKTWLAKGENRPTLCFAIDRKHAMHLQERFLEAGVPCEYIDANTPLFEHEVVFARLKSGDAKIISSVATIDTGVDIDCQCLIDARPTKSKIRYIQTDGRGPPKPPGKTDVIIILGHAGNVRRHGIVTDIQWDRLDDGDLVQSAERLQDGARPNIKLCPECHAVLPPGARECPECGHKLFAVTQVHETDDELVELGSAGTGAKHETDERQWYAGLLWLRQDAMRRGKAYKLNWPDVNLKTKFGYFPPYSWRSLAPAEPTIEIRNWVRSRQIAFAKAMSAGR